MRKIPAIAAGLVFATAAATASAQVYYDRSYTYDPYYGSRGLDSNSECWNPRAGHFEQVRPGEVQNDLDFSRCRGYGGRYYDNGRYAERRYYGGSRQECWNPRAGHYEEVRPGEAQGDLDFGRCRVYR
jgi:hypothetical protein